VNYEHQQWNKPLHSSAEGVKHTRMAIIACTYAFCAIVSSDLCLHAIVARMAHTCWMRPAVVAPQQRTPMPPEEHQTDSDSSYERFLSSLNPQQREAGGVPAFTDP
jgi:hypothetical protein